MCALFVWYYDRARFAYEWFTFLNDGGVHNWTIRVFAFGTRSFMSFSLLEVYHFIPSSSIYYLHRCISICICTFIKIYVIILQWLQCTGPKPTKCDQIVGKSSDGEKNLPTRLQATFYGNWEVSHAQSLDDSVKSKEEEEGSQQHEQYRHEIFSFSNRGKKVDWKFMLLVFVQFKISFHFV